MLGGILVILLTYGLSQGVKAWMIARYPYVKASTVEKLFWYHLFLAICYYLYAMASGSDSMQYFRTVNYAVYGADWGFYYGTSTTFIKFLAYPFVNYFNFTYEGMMFLFSFLGFVGFCFFYIFLKENIRFKHQLFGYDLLAIVLFLPNLHFWSSSLGKGSVIFLGFGLFFYGISKLSTRMLATGIALVIIYHVRPHIAMVLIMSSIAGFMFSTKGISMTYRFIFLIFATAVFAYIFNDVMKMVGLDEDASQALDLDHRASELTKASSGIDITNYSWPEKIFAFLYRPLFFDAPGILGWIVSPENLFYLIITFRLINFKGLKFMWSGDFMVKTAFLSFLTTTIALAQISGNLGLAMRQKSQVMMLFMFVILKFLDEQKMPAYRAWMRAKKRKEEEAKLSGSVVPPTLNLDVR